MTTIVPQNLTNIPLPERQTASSSANLTFALDQNYDCVEFEFLNILPATISQTLYMQFSVDGGTTFISTGSTYQYRRVGQLIDTDTLTRETSTGSDNMTFRFSNTVYLENTAGKDINGYINLRSVAGKRINFDFDLTAWESSGGKFGSIKGIGFQGNPSGSLKVTHVRFLMSSGNLASGSIVRRYKLG